MGIQPKEVVLYTTEDDACPFEHWLNALRDRRARARIKTRLDRVSMGNLGDAKPVELTMVQVTECILLNLVKR